MASAKTLNNSENLKEGWSLTPAGVPAREKGLGKPQEIGPRS
jgi:hypothetical protein